MSAKQNYLIVDDYLEHIEEAATLATSYVAGMDKTSSETGGLNRQLFTT